MQSSTACKETAVRVLSFSPQRSAYLTKLTFQAMKLTAILLLTVCLSVSAKSNSQTITFSGKNVKLEVVLKSIEKQSGYHVVYNHKLLENIGVTVNAKNVILTDFLDNVLRDQLLSYLIQNTTIF